jgi:hypothetical protein
MVKKNYKGYEIEDNKEEFIHRKRAYHIYLENRDKYPLPYSAYEVHHIDFDKTNNKVSNLQILTPTEHDKIHEEHDKLIKKQDEKELEEVINSNNFVNHINSRIIKLFEENKYSFRKFAIWIKNHRGAYNSEITRELDSYLD